MCSIEHLSFLQIQFKQMATFTNESILGCFYCMHESIKEGTPSPRVKMNGDQCRGRCGASRSEMKSAAVRIGGVVDDDDDCDDDDDDRSESWNARVLAALAVA